ncbi:O-antigen ligase family protein [Cohnella lupini]|uniref:O-antigen ligase-like membrane protein n=1 Tax=Cohnella lupini TaxID=1294267 RepID=A0A3D9IVS3_9BACL|nr:O-antigen ligase family protein [Cohnella lupini]RED65821.1 O-antigen ligase-like membrane protein [Cohnella lupini]
MNRHHIWFLLFLLMAIVAPKISLSWIVGGNNSLSLGIIGLLGWLIFTKRGQIKVVESNQKYLLKIILCIGLYCLTISVFTLNIVSILYSIQYFMYIFLSLLVYRRYLNEIVISQIGMNTLVNILLVVGFISALGVFLSLAVGPIYASQVGAYTIHWNGLNLTRGVGFYSSANFAGTFQMIFSLVGIFLQKYATLRYKKLITFLIIVSLLLTFSRSAIFSFIIAFCFVYGIRLFSGLLNNNLKLKLKSALILILVINIFVIFVISLYLNKNSVILQGFFGEQFSNDLLSRTEKWNSGWSMWLEMSKTQEVLGVGFRNSMQINPITGAWMTPHNFYIAFLIEFGLIGLALYLIIIISMFLRTCLNIYNKFEQMNKFILGTFIALMIQNYSELFLYDPVLVSILILVIYFSIYQKHLKLGN